MAQKNNGEKQASVGTTNTVGVTTTKIVNLVVVDGKIVADTSNVRNGVLQ